MHSADEALDCRAPATAALKDAGHNHSPLVLKVTPQHALGNPKRERRSLDSPLNLPQAGRCIVDLRAAGAFDQDFERVGFVLI